MKLDKLWAPWRIVYIERGDLNGEQCFLCEKHKTPDMDSENFVLYRGKHSYVLLNAFPYNNGHLMIAPYRHTGEFENLSDDELLEMMIVSRLAVSAISQEMGAQGFNIGINIGCVAGAGKASGDKIVWIDSRGGGEIISGHYVSSQDLYYLKL